MDSSDSNHLSKLVLIVVPFITREKDKQAIKRERERERERERLAVKGNAQPSNGYCSSEE